MSSRLCPVCRQERIDGESPYRHAVFGCLPPFGAAKRAFLLSSLGVTPPGFIQEYPAGGQSSARFIADVDGSQLAKLGER